MLSQHPGNLTLRFFLEIIALVSIGQWAWANADQHGVVQYLFGIGLPLLFALLWMVFKTPGELGSTKKVILPVPGWVRLLIEAVFFSFAILCVINNGQGVLALALGVALLLHYFWSADRVVWLIKH